MDKDALQTELSRFDKSDKYRVEETLNSSSIEITELVYQISADGSQSGPFIRKRFNDEGTWSLYKKIMAEQHRGLRDPALPRIIEVGQDSQGWYSVIEFVQGSNLRDAQISAVLPVFESVCKAVDVLHTKFDPPIIHRDIKPDNVIVAGDSVVLIDFGAARSFDEAKDCDTHFYATRAYASPEQFGYAQTDPRSDIYSLGMLLVFLETGQDPDSELKQAIRDGEEALIELGIDAPYAKTITKACAFDPSFRFKSVSEMLEYLHSELDIADLGDISHDASYRDVSNGDSLFKGVSSGDIPPRDVSNGDTPPRGVPTGVASPRDVSNRDALPQDVSNGDVLPQDVSNGVVPPHNVSNENMPPATFSADAYQPPNAGSIYTNATDPRTTSTEFEGKSGMVRDTFGAIQDFREQWRLGKYAKIGKAWDIILLLTWLFFLIVAISLCFESGPGDQSSVFEKIVSYIGVAMSFLSIIAICLMDWRPIRTSRHFYKLRKAYLITFFVVVFLICLIVSKFAFSAF